MRSLRNGKANELSVIEPALKKFRTKRSNAGKFNDVEIVIDKTIVNRYLAGKNSLRDGLELNSNIATTTCRSQKNKSHTSNLEQIATIDSVKIHENSSGTSNFVVKIEAAADIKDDLCTYDNFLYDNLLVKQELPNETLNIKRSSASETDMLTFDHKESKEPEPNNFLIKEEEFSHTIESIKIQPTDSSHSINYFPDDDLTVEEEFKFENLIPKLDEEREVESYYENLENQSNSASVIHSIANESMTSGHYYKCNNCDFKSISKKLISRHIFNNYFDKDNFFPCEKCKKKFKTKKILKYHQRSCGTVLCFKCKFCPKITNKRFFMKRHIISQHSDDFEMEELDGIMQEIIMAKERKDKNEMAEVLKKISIKKRRARNIFDRNKFIKMFCSKCNVVSERGRATIAMDCCNCGTTLMFQCQMCRKSYDKICAMRSHVKWSCESAEIKMMKNNAVLSNLVHDKKIIVHTKLNPLLDELSLPEENQLTHYECKECTNKNFKTCRHIEYKRAGCRYERGLAICPKCNSKFKILNRCMEHQIFCHVQFRFACPFCHYTANSYQNVKRHLSCSHISKFDLKKLEDIVEEVRNERNIVREKYKTDCRSSKMFQIALSSDS